MKVRGIATVLTLCGLCPSIALAQEAAAGPVPATDEGPAAGSIVLEANAGVPKLKSNDFRLLGDATLGYSSEKLGAIAHGSFGYYDFESGTAISDTTRVEGSAEGWFVSGAQRDALRFEVRAAGGFARYDTTYAGTVSATALQDQTSDMGRGSLLIGGRAHGRSTALLVLLGGGIQIEDYSTVAVTNTVSLEDTTTTTFRGEARVEGRWTVAPGAFSLRGRFHVTRFGIHRASEAIQVGGAVTTSSAVIDKTQLELSSRLFGEIDAARFLGIVPAVFAGLDLVQVTGGGESTSVTVPMGGIGLIKPVW
jgi:hypothetical protein